jgi:3-isopropylmalate/(R)-2-methylmalate dehydratase small subunit
MYAADGYELSIDLEQQVVQTPSGESIRFDVDAFRKHCLLNGLDDIALTLESAEAIRGFERNWRQQSPWLFDVIR